MATASALRSDPNAPAVDAAEEESETEETAAEPAEEGDEGDTSARYPTKGRGTMGVRDIKTTERNGPVVAIVSVREEDELMMMTARGKIQRIAVSDVSVIGRNTQGVRIMSLDEADTLAAVVRVPKEDSDGTEPVIGDENPSTDLPAMPPNESLPPEGATDAQ